MTTHEQPEEEAQAPDARYCNATSTAIWGQQLACALEPEHDDEHHRDRSGVRWSRA